MSSRSVRAPRAFTIIELLVALTITAAISAMMVTIVVNVLGAWNRSSATLNTGNQARQILDQLALDLQGAVVSRSTDVTFAATIPKNQTAGGDAFANDAASATTARVSWAGTDVKPGDTAAPNGSLLLNPADRDLATYRFGQVGIWLRFFTIPSDNTVSSGSISLSNLTAPRAVSYQIMRRQVGSGSSPYTYQLYRSEIRPAGTNAGTIARSTFTHGYDLFGANGYNNPNDAANGGTAAGDAGCVRRPNASFVLGNGVIDFGIRVLVRSEDTRDLDGDTITDEFVLYEVFPVDRRISDANSSIRRVLAVTSDVNNNKVQPNTAFVAGNNFTAPQTSYSNYYPSVVEVMVRILSPEGIQIIQSYEEDPSRYGGASPSKWWELAEANSKVYVRRVEIRATAL